MPFHLGVSGWVFQKVGHLLYPPWVRSVLEMVGWLLPEGGNVLDVGGGTGTMGTLLARPRDLPVWVADPAPGMLRHGKGIRPILARTPGLPFREKVFSAVCAGEALHHFRDVDEALEEMVTLLAPDGYLVIYDFDPSTVMGKTLCFAERALGEPGNFFSPPTLQQRFIRRGFHVRVYARNFRYVLIASPERSHIFEEVVS